MGSRIVIHGLRVFRPHMLARATGRIVDIFVEGRRQRHAEIQDSFWTGG